MTTTTNYTIFDRANNSLSAPVDRRAAQVAMDAGLEVFELVQVELDQLEDELADEEAAS